MNDLQTHHASRVILATPRAIFRALIDPEAIASWRPPRGMSARITAFDARRGGGYRMEFRYDEAGDNVGKTLPGVDVVCGTFVELVADEQIVEAVRFETDDAAFAGTMTITTTLEPDRDGTRVTIVAANVPPGISEDDHRAVMDSTLKNLANFIE